MVPAGNLLGQRKKVQRHLDVGFGALDGVTAQPGMRLHDRPLISGQLFRFEQDMVGNANLADVVQGGRATQQVDVLIAQRGGKAWMALQGAGQMLDIGLRAQNVVAGFRIADFGQMCQRTDADLLGEIIFGHAPRDFPFQVNILVFQQIGTVFDLQLGTHPRQHDRRGDWLGDVVGSTELQAPFLIADRCQRRQEDDRNVGRQRVVAQAGQYLVAVHAGHHHVEEDQLGPGGAARHAQATFTACRGEHLVLWTQQIAEHQEILGGIVNNQNDGRGLGGHGFSLACRQRKFIHLS